MGNSTPRLPLVARDEWLRPAEKELELRHRLYEERLAEILRTAGSLTDYANGYRYYGWQRDEDLDGWWFREWLPGAQDVYLFLSLIHISEPTRRSV